jgi:hypothetical protein
VGILCHVARPVFTGFGPVASKFKIQKTGLGLVASKKNEKTGLDQTFKH